MSDRLLQQYRSHPGLFVMKNNRDLSDWLRRERLVTKVTQDELADVVGLTKQSISHYENERRQLWPHRLDELARALGYRIEIKLHIDPRLTTLGEKKHGTE